MCSEFVALAFVCLCGCWALEGVGVPELCVGVFLLLGGGLSS